MSSKQILGIVAITAISACGAMWKLHLFAPQGASAARRATRAQTPLSPSPVASNHASRIESAASTAEKDPIALQQIEAEWDRLAASAVNTPQYAALLVDLLEELAAIAPSRALAKAQNFQDPAIKNQLYLAIARGWANKNPSDAAAWARTQSEVDAGLFIAEIFKSLASSNPHAAFRLESELGAQGPSGDQTYSRYLVAALSEAGKFGESAAFAAASNAHHPDRGEVLSDAYARWAGHEPRASLDAALQLKDPAQKDTAFKAAISRWAYADPQAAANYALGVPSEQSRTFAIAVALPAWAVRDPVAAAAWAGRLDPTPELDQAMATIATHPLVLRQPENALMWAEGIVDPQCKIRVLATVLNGWAAINPDAARRQAETLAAALPEQREALFAAFSPGFEPMSLLP